jgi:hypothetical protein
VRVRIFAAGTPDVNGDAVRVSCPGCAKFYSKTALAADKANNGLICLFSQPFYPGRHDEIDFRTLYIHSGLELIENFCSGGARDP